MLAAGGAAFAAWAIIEPFFEDHFYFEGPVQFVKNPPLSGNGQWIKIKDQDIWLTNKALAFKPDDKIDLQEGKVLGVWAQVPREERHGEKPLLVGFRAVADPPSPSSRLASMNFDQQVAQQNAAAMLLLPLTAAMIGLALGAADGLVCRLPR